MHFLIVFANIFKVMSDTTHQTYELAFHITSNLDEADVQKTCQDLEKLATSHGGVVLFARNPERFRLAYPIKHQSNAFFGYFNFNLESPESINQIRNELRLNNNILRFLILKQKPESKTRKEDIVRRLATAERRKAKARVAEKAVPKAEAPKMDEGTIEKKLEEILK